MVVLIEAVGDESAGAYQNGAVGEHGGGCLGGAVATVRTRMVLRIRAIITSGPAVLHVL